MPTRPLGHPTAARSKNLSWRGESSRILRQLDVQRLGDGLYGLVEYLFLGRSAEDEPAEAADRRLLQDPVLQGLAFVELRRHVTPGTGQCVVEPVGTNVVPPQLSTRRPTRLHRRSRRGPVAPPSRGCGSTSRTGRTTSCAGRTSSSRRPMSASRSMWTFSAIAVLA